MTDHVCKCGDTRSEHRRVTIPYEHFTYCMACTCHKYEMPTVTEAVLSTAATEPAPYYDRFDDILEEMSKLHNKKGLDYGAVNDPYANVRGSTAFGIDAWVGALVRLNDKIVRLQSFIRNGKLANESVEDSIQDIAVYAVIMRILYDEQYAKVKP
jgi:hypothetical protein